jgi:hypothetical protein
METKSVEHNCSVTEKSEYWALYYRKIMKLNTRDYINKAFFVEQMQLLGRGRERYDPLLNL